MRTCTRCHQTKPEDDFRWQPTVSRFHTWCRVCEREHRRSTAGTNRATRRSASRRDNAGRAFGIEMELTGPSATIIIRALTNAGLRVHQTQRGYSATTGDLWEVKHDGSVHGAGIELASPKLSGADGFDQLRRACYALQEVGATVDASTGLHVHIDFRGANVGQMKAQLLPILYNQENVYRMMAPSRRSNGYCPRWRAEQIAALEGRDNRSTTVSGLGTRGVVNLGAFGRHGSVEFRTHGGSTSFKKIGAWVRFLLAVCEYNGSVLPRHNRHVYDTPAEWLNAVASGVTLSRADQTVLLRFENAAAALETAEYTEREEVTV